MQYINTMKEGMKLKDVYLVKKLVHAQTKAGKEYWNVTLQDKTGAVDAKVWDPESPGINDFDAKDFIWVVGEVTVFNNANQVNIRQARKADEGSYDPADYVPCSEKNTDEMYAELLGIIDTIKAPYMKKLLEHFYKDEAFKKKFCYHSAARSVHHGFVGGLLEHTLSVTKVCDFFSKNYPMLDRDLLLTAAICHDIGKTEELSPYPENDYTDEGQLLGHIVIGAGMLRDAIKDIPEFPHIKENELLHCILSHHGELEFGSPKKPALAEAIALSFADNVDAKMETIKEALGTNSMKGTEWQGFNKYLDSNIRRTAKIED
ncbi:MAG: HD domain-containing protein [Lachnospiraceae bacterium]|nr:HD domain-containing protein [Lachnospiraceae bacterium]